MGINNMMEVPGASDIPSLGVLSRMQSDQSRPEYSQQTMQSDLMNEFRNAMNERQSAREDMGEYYRDAMDSLKTPVQDNSWLHLALGALKPTLPWGNGVLNGAIEAENEEQRAHKETLQNRLLYNKLGMEWQKQNIGDLRDESDKLMARLASGDKSAQNIGAFARQSTSLYTQQFENYRKQAEVMTNIPPAEKEAWIREHAMASTREAMRQLSPAWEQAGVPISVQEKIFSPGAGVFQQPKDTSTTEAGTETGTKAINIVSTNIPNDVQSEIDKQIIRMNANPNNKALRENTLRRLREISAQYPASPEQLQSFKADMPKDSKNSTSETATTGAPVSPNDLQKTPKDGGLTIAEIAAAAAGGKAQAEAVAKGLEGSGDLLVKSYEKLGSFPKTVQTLNDAMDSWSKSKDQFGAGGETFNKIASFMNNRFGMKFSPEEVADAQAFRATMGRFGAALSRQTDSQPAQKLIEMTMQHVGSLENDPNAVPKIINDLYNLSKIDVDIHNKRYDQAVGGGFKSYYPLTIDTPKLITAIGVDRKTGKRVARYSDGTKGFMD